MDSKVALISGAGGSLGTAVASHFRARGMRVALIDRNAAALETLCAQLGGNTEAIWTGAVDLTQQDETEAFVQQAIARFGRLDALINVAGGFTYSGPVHEMNLADFDAMYTINVRTAAVLSATAAKRMVEAGRGGRIVFIAARAALTGSAGIAAYSASKSALLRLMESMAAELLPHQITVNAVLPSIIDTAPNRAAMPDADFTRWVTPDSLADVIEFLVSEATRDITGAALPVYGRS